MKHLEIDPKDGWALSVLHDSYGQKGMQKESIEYFNRIARLFGYDGVALAVQRAYAASGEPGAIRESIRQMASAYAQGRFDRPVMVAVEYARLGDKEQALTWLQKAVADRSADVPFLNCEPTLVFLRSDRRYQGLLRRVGLPQ